MKTFALAILVSTLTLGGSLAAQPITYDLRGVGITGDNCPLRPGSIRVSADGRQISIASPGFNVNLLPLSNGLLEAATCVIRIPVSIAANTIVQQLAQEMHYSYQKSGNSTISIKSSVNLLDLDATLIDVNVGPGLTGQRSGVRRTSTIDLSRWPGWCQASRTDGILAINLGISTVRASRSDTLRAQIGGPSVTPYRVQIDARPCS